MRNKMGHWESSHRTQATIKKAVENEQLKDLFNKYKDIIYGVCKDKELVANTYMRLTYEFNEKNDFMQQWMRLYKKLKYIYALDQRFANIRYTQLTDNEADDLENQ